MSISSRFLQHCSQKQRAVILVSCAAILIFTTLVLIASNPNPTPQFNHPVPSTSYPRDDSVLLNPSVDHKNGSELIWQAPDAPKAVLLIFPGCQIRAADYWDPSPACPQCDGLPEDRLLVIHALSRRFAVLAVSSWEHCWTFGPEMDAVEWIISFWLRERRLGDLPVFALGASSGGYFVSALSTRVSFTAIVVMIAEGMFDRMDVSKDYPPTLFVHMPKDQERARLVSANMIALKKKGVETREIRCMEFPVSPDLLADRIPGVNQSLASKVFDILRDKGFLDEKAYMLRDGRSTRWKKAAEEAGILSKDFRWTKHITEELNVAYAYHEFTSMHNDEIFEWFETHMKR